MDKAESESGSTVPKSPGFSVPLASELLFENRPAADVEAMSAEALRLIVVEIVERSASKARAGDETVLTAKHVQAVLLELLVDLL